MTITAAKTITFDDLMKLFKKYVSKSETRPVLNYVYYANGYFTATNSHILLRVNADHVSDIPESMVDGKLFDPKQMVYNTEQMKYPDVSRLIPTSTYSDSMVIIDGNIKEFHQYIKEIKKVVKKNDNKVMKLDFKQNGLTLSGISKETGETYSAAMKSMHVEGKEITLHINANYMDVALDTIKKLSKLSRDYVTLNMVSNMRPIHFNQDGVFDIIILPVRIY
jgi:hypothetical protein